MKCNINNYSTADQYSLIQIPATVYRWTRHIDTRHSIHGCPLSISQVHSPSIVCGGGGGGGGVVAGASSTTGGFSGAAASLAFFSFGCLDSLVASDTVEIIKGSTFACHDICKKKNGWKLMKTMSASDTWLCCRKGIAPNLLPNMSGFGSVVVSGWFNITLLKESFMDDSLQ